MKKTNKQPSAYEKYLEVKHEAIQDLLQERESLKQKLKDEAAKIKKLMAENAKKLAALDYAVKDAGVGPSTSGNERLPDPEIKKGLERILAHKPHSVPEMCQLLCIARSRFEKFAKNHPNFLKQEGGVKKTKKTKYSLNPRRTK
jgi:mannitol-specific phosphotransferase system IIBC component